MAWIPHSITEFGEIEVDDADPKRKRARMYQRRRRRRRDDGVCVPFEVVEEGAAPGFGVGDGVEVGASENSHRKERHG